MCFRPILFNDKLNQKEKIAKKVQSPNSLAKNVRFSILSTNKSCSKNFVLRMRDKMIKKVNMTPLYETYSLGRGQAINRRKRQSEMASSLK